jgi:prolipoprotein diacylglyceryltransferase
MPNGQLFRLFVLGYFSWRFFVEFIKPRETYGGLSPIQITCLLTVAYTIFLMWRRPLAEPAVPQTAANNVS